MDKHLKKAVRTTRVMDTVRRKIANRTLAPGERLPSIRQFARSLNVSASTVVEAYDRLTAEGEIYAKRGSGFYVANGIQPFEVCETGPRFDRAVDPFWVSRQSLDAVAETEKPGCGWLPTEWMPNVSIRKALRNLARSDDATLSDYGSTLGSSKLRRWLSRQFADEGLAVDADKVLLTSSGTQAIDLICRLLLRPGDSVIVDDPCYFNFQALLRAHQVNIIGVRYTQTGPDPEAFERALIEHSPRMYITNSVLHNPTGAALAMQTAHTLLKLASAHELIIVEDDIFAGFGPAQSLRMAALDGLQQVIRIGSFSKTLSASMRCGYIAARPDWIDALSDLQLATNFGGPSPVASEVIYTTLSNGNYRKHMDGLRNRLDGERDRVTTELRAIGIEPWVVPNAGFYLWCRLPDGVDGADLAQSALKENIVLAPGNVFSVSQSCSEFMRFNISQMSRPAIFAALNHHVNMVRSEPSCQS